MLRKSELAQACNVQAGEAARGVEEEGRSVEAVQAGRCMLGASAGLPAVLKEAGVLSPVLRPRLGEGRRGHWVAVGAAGHPVARTGLWEVGSVGAGRGCRAGRRGD